MTLGIFMVIGVGLIWVFVGVMMSYVARQGIDNVVRMAVSSAVCAAVAWAFWAKYDVLLAGDAPRLSHLAAAFMTAACANCLGVIVLEKAMRCGHHGIVWTVAQTALLFPFLAGIVFFGESVVPRKAAGVVFILLSLAIFGILRERKSPHHAGAPSRAWFPLALLAMLLLGLHQTCITVPSHWENWSDAANMRMPFFYIASTASYWSVAGVRRRPVTRRAVIVGLVSSILGLVSAPLMYAALDQLETTNMVSLAYPVAVGTCIVGFALYSLVFLRERATAWHLVGIAAGLVGIVLIAM